MLLKTVSKSPTLFCYFVAIQEAKELLGQKESSQISEKILNESIKPLTDC